jgi:hypothetical protein
MAVGLRENDRGACQEAALEANPARGTMRYRLRLSSTPYGLFRATSWHSLSSRTHACATSNHARTTCARVGAARGASSCRPLHRQCRTNAPPQSLRPARTGCSIRGAKITSAKCEGRQRDKERALPDESLRRARHCAGGSIRNGPSGASCVGASSEQLPDRTMARMSVVNRGCPWSAAAGCFRSCRSISSCIKPPRGTGRPPREWGLRGSSAR